MIEFAPMTLDEYQHLAARTINPKLTEREMVRHALFGLASEVGEIHGLHQKVYQGHYITVDHLIKEVGDALWMIAELCTAYDIALGEVAETNIEKLRQRYPDGFDEEHSLHRKPNDI